MKTQYINLHIHHGMKLLGRSFERNPGVNNPNRNGNDSLWYFDPPTFTDKAINIIATLTKFRQSDFTSLARGGAEIIFCVAVSAEKGFVMTKMGTKLPGDAVANLVSGLGKALTLLVKLPAQRRCLPMLIKLNSGITPYFLQD